MTRIMLLLFVASCGGADIGEECENSSSTEECVDGAVCTKEATQTVCRKQCETQDDCPDGTTCNGIANGSGKSCQP